MPSLTPVGSGTLLLTPTGAEESSSVSYDGFYPSMTTYPSDSLYPGEAFSSSTSPNTLILTPSPPA